MLRDLMVAAFGARGVPCDAIQYRRQPLQGNVAAPAGVFMQQAGMVALNQAGVDVVDLAKRGTAMTRVAILNEAGSRPILEYAPSLPNAGPLPIFLPLTDVRDAIKQAASASLPINETTSAAIDSSADWSLARCPATLGRVVSGRLRKSGSLILWTGTQVHVGVAPLPEGRLFCYAISRQIMDKDNERQLCTAALDEVPLRLASELAEVEGVSSDSWFPFEDIGYRPSRAPGTDVLRWGSSLLRLHPLTGQHLAYWAIQSTRLADDFARNNGPSPEFFARLDRNNALMHARQRRALGFHLAPSSTWRALRRAITLLSRMTPPLRRRAIRRLALLDFL
jgi:hypothetical protein